MKELLVIGINEKIHTTRRIIEEAKKRNRKIIFAKWSSISFYNKKLYTKGKEIKLKKISSVFFDISRFSLKIKKDKKVIDFSLDNDLFAILKILKKNRIAANNRDFFLNYPFYNKFTQQYVFNDKKIPSIDTLHMTDNVVEKVQKELKNFRFSFPIVVKESNGGMGDKVWKIKNSKELEVFLQDRRNVNLVFQQYIKNKEDFRVVVIGKRSLGIMRRKAQKGQWKNNYALGGKVEKYKDKKMERFAENVCKKIGIDYAGVDILKSGSRYLVIEINIFFSFEGFERAYKDINVAEKILDTL
jgi:RimK family alpha-L-glutamate ligase